MVMKKKNFLKLAAIAGVLALGLAGCSSGDSGGQEEENDGAVDVVAALSKAHPDFSVVKKNDALAATVPASIRDKGTLTIGTTGGGVPTSFTTEKGELRGVDIDLGNAIGTVLGLKVKFDVVSEEGLMPGIESERFDYAMRGVNAARLKVVDITTAYENGIALLANTNVKGTDMDLTKELCGLKVGVVKGGYVETWSTQQSEACVARGEKPLEISSFSESAAVILAVLSKQVDASVSTVISAAAYASTDPKRLHVGGIAWTGGTGVATKKGNDALRDALRGALFELAKVGFYQDVLTQYGMKDSINVDFPLNNAVS